MDPTVDVAFSLLTLHVFIPGTAAMVQSSFSTPSAKVLYYCHLQDGLHIATVKSCAKMVAHWVNVFDNT